MLIRRSFLFVLGMVLGLGACNARTPVTEDERLQLMATTSIVGDIVQQVGGDTIKVEILLPLGTDPHSFTPTPQDIARLGDAELVFINGAGLEEFLIATIESAGVDVHLVDLSMGIPLRSLEASAEADEQGSDPHTWMDPINVITWTQTIADALADLDPQHRDIYYENASNLLGELEALDLWVRAQVEQLPGDHRRLVTDHLVFGYFTDRYGFEQIGAVISGFSTLSEPSAQEVAQLEDDIKKLGVPALFVGWTANQNLARRIADDTGIQIIPLFTHSLSEEGGDAEHYQDFIRYNVNAMVSGLR